MTTFQPKDFQQRAVVIGDLQVKVTSCLLGVRYSAQVENSDGGVIGRGRGDTREAAEEAAISGAASRITLSHAAESFRRSVGHLKP